MSDKPLTKMKKGVKHYSVQVVAEYFNMNDNHGMTDEEVKDMMARLSKETIVPIMLSAESVLSWITSYCDNGESVEGMECFLNVAVESIQEQRAEIRRRFNKATDNGRDLCE